MSIHILLADWSSFKNGLIFTHWRKWLFTWHIFRYILALLDSKWSIHISKNFFQNFSRIFKTWINICNPIQWGERTKLHKCESSSRWDGSKLSSIMLQIWSLMTLKFDFWKPCYNYNMGYTVNCVRFLYIHRT